MPIHVLGLNCAPLLSNSDANIYFILGITGKDMFSMLKAEKRAFEKVSLRDQPAADFDALENNKKANVWNAVILSLQL